MKLTILTPVFCCCCCWWKCEEGFNYINQNIVCVHISVCMLRSCFCTLACNNRLLAYNYSPFLSRSLAVGEEEIVECIPTYLNNLYINSLCESDENSSQCSHAWNINYHENRIHASLFAENRSKVLARLLYWNFVRKTNMKLNSNLRAEHWWEQTNNHKKRFSRDSREILSSLECRCERLAHFNRLLL